MKIAVIGIGCRYPGATSAQQLFENVMAGRQAFRQVPPQRWRLEDYYHPDKKHADTTYCKQAAFVENFLFNPEEFRIPRITYNATDTAHWLALKVADEALADAGVKDINRDTVGVIVGNTLTGEVSRASVLRYRWPYVRKVICELLEQLALNKEQQQRLINEIETRYKAAFPPVNEDNLAGGLSNTIAGRICNFFDFKGGGFSTDGACSSSLLAIYQACIALQHGACDLALAGGVDISLDPFEMVGFAKVGALSDAGIHVYDDQSAGFLPGEGCGMVVLQRYEDAIAQGASIYGVINGIGISSDGKGGITAPSVEGQSFAVDRAYLMADYSFADVELIEGHGTGTPTGDSVELQTFINAFKRHNALEDHRCGVGSVKSIIGHTKAAAGVAGFIKAVMAVCHNILPPTQGIRTPNRLFQHSTTLYPLCLSEPWDNPDGVCRAAVSSAGFGGINSHITLSNVDKASSRYNEKQRQQYLSLSCSAQSSEVLFIGSATFSDLREQVATLSEVTEQISIAELGDLSRYTATALKSHRIRLAVVVQSPLDASDKLNELLALLDAQMEDEQNQETTAQADSAHHTRHISEFSHCDFSRGIFLQTQLSQPQVAFLFPGQGSQSVNMGFSLRQRSDRAAKCWQRCDDQLKTMGKPSVSDMVFIQKARTSSRDTQQHRARLQDTAVAQPALTTMSLALTEFLRDLGIRPDMVAGHSLGEYAALYCAGVLDMETTLRLVSARGEAMAQTAGKPSGMLSVGATPARVRELMQEVVGELVIANKNSPKQTVVSGELTALSNLKELCTFAAIAAERLPVSHAFHSSLMTPASNNMAETLKQARYRRLRTLTVSPSTVDFLSDNTDFAQMLQDQILQPVDFIGAMELLLEEGCRLFVEVGPGHVLSALAEQIAGDRDVLVCPADIGDRGQYSEGLNRLVAYLFSCGVTLNLDELFYGRFLRPFPWPYATQFITSPCETDIEPLTLKTRFATAMALSELDVTDSKTDSLEPHQPESQINATIKNAESHAAATVEEKTSQVDATALPETSVEAVVESLRQYVMNSYGYSAEFVTPQAKLQDNLGLDSLKSVEVAYEIMGGLGVRGDISQLGDASIETLAAYIVDLKNKSDQSGGAQLGQGLTSVMPSWVRAFTREMVEAEQEALPNELLLPADSRVLIVYEKESALLQVLTEALAKHDINCECQSYSNSPWLVSKFTICIYLANAQSGISPILDLSAPTLKHHQQRPQSLLLLAKNLIHQSVAQGAMAKKQFVFVTETGGQFDTVLSAEPEISAGAGFVRTLHLEHTDIQTLCLDINASLDNEAKATSLVSELLTSHQTQGHRDIGYWQRNKRSRLCYKPCAVNRLPTNNAMQAGDVLLVSGGAKGITAECVMRLAQTQHYKLALLGSTPAQIDNDTNADSSTHSQSSAELQQNLKRFTAAGVDYRYYCCDIGNSDAVKNVVEKIVAELGVVRGVIHAAGINHFHKIADTEWDVFETVLVPKADGLVNLLNAIEVQSLSHLAVFSSVIGSSGMAANASYAYANEWMDQLLIALAQTHSQVNVQSYGFSVWRDVGMGHRLNSVDLLANMGIDAIGVEQGIDLFLRLYQRRWPQAQMVISARMGHLDTMDFAFPTSHPTRFTEQVLYLQPGVEMICEVCLQPEVDAYLNDHSYEDSLLFPAVVGIEAMVQCAQFCRQGHPQEKPHSSDAVVYPHLENLHFERAIVVPQEGRKIRIYVQFAETDQQGEERAQVFIRSEVTDYQIDYFSADCVWRNAADVTGVLADNVNTGELSDVGLEPANDLYGKILFQGAMFQHIECYLQLSSTHCIVRINVPKQNQLFSNDLNTQSMALGSAQLRDAYLHAVQLCVPEHKILPVSMQCVDFLGVDTDFVTLYAQERERTDNEFLYDLEVYDASGLLLERIVGFRCRIVGDYDDQEILQCIQSAHKKSQDISANS